jgi:hypothetical protein
MVNCSPGCIKKLVFSLPYPEMMAPLLATSNRQFAATHHVDFPGFPALAVKREERSLLQLFWVEGKEQGWLVRNEERL